MKTIVFLLCLLVFHFGVYAQPTDPNSDPIPMSMGYEANDGQLIGSNGTPVPRIKFLSDGFNIQTYFSKGTVSYVTVRSPIDTLTPDSITPPDTVYRVDMRFVDGDTVTPQASGAYPDYRNYYLAHTMPNGVDSVLRYKYLLYADVRPGIDVWLYGGPAGQKYAFVCAPGSDPSRLKLHFDGHSSLTIGTDSSLLVGADLFPIRLPKAKAYEVNGSSLSLLGWTPSYTIGTDVTFQIGSYDTTKPLLIFVGESVHAPPGGGIEGICWSTYFGGNRFDKVHESTTDNSDNYYVTGHMWSNWWTFPFTTNLVNIPGLRSAFVAKFTPAEERQWTAILGGGGGTSTYSQAIALREGAVRFLYIGGVTFGSGLFTTASGGAYLDATGTVNTTQSFIAKFAPNGAITWSTYWGNFLTNIQGMAISDNRLVIAGGTREQLPVPLTPLPPPASLNPFLANPNSSDAFVCLFNTTDQVIWTYYLSGNADEICYDVRAMGLDFVVYGTTRSTDFPTETLITGAYVDPTANGQTDLFVAHFSVQAQRLWCTYFGSNQQEEAGLNGLAVSPYNKDIYIVGQTQSANNNLPITWVLPQSYYDVDAEAGRTWFHRPLFRRRPLASMVYFLRVVRLLPFDPHGHRGC